MSSEGSPSVNDREATELILSPEPVSEPRAVSPEIQPQPELPHAAPLPHPEMYQAFIAAWMAMHEARGPPQVQFPPAPGPEIRTVAGTVLPRGY